MTETETDTDIDIDTKKWKQDGKSTIRKVFLVILGPLIIITAGLWLYLSGDRYITTDNAYIKSEKTSISSEISGKIIKVNVEDNTHVAKGDELFLIDPEIFQIAVNSAEANVTSARSEIESLRSDYLKTVAELATEEENVRYRKDEYRRFKDLDEKKLVPKEKRDQAYYDYNTAVREYDTAKQEIEVLKARLGGNPEINTEDHPRFKLAKAELEKAKLDLSRVKVVAPSAGIAANVTVAPGEYLTAGIPLFTLVNDQTQWIEANFKETDLTHMRLGQKAEIEVDTYPGVIWTAKVLSITPATGSEFSILPAQNSSGNWVKVVQRIMVKLEIVDKNEKSFLAAGMSIAVTVDTGASRLDRMMDRYMGTKG
tara:strand:- start:11862 stop:12968 length:1107 start_codon:yes stop_codon:yes gene_type:complete